MKILKWVPLSLGVFALLGLNLSFFSVQAVAGEDLTDIASQNLLKKEMIRKLSESVKRHKTMTYEEIKKEIGVSLTRTLDRMRESSQVSSRAYSVVQSESGKLESLTTKEQIIEAEEQTLKSLVSAANWVFYTMRGFYGSRGMDGETKFWISFGTLGVVPIFLLALDLASLPITVIVSAITGW